MIEARYSPRMWESALKELTRQKLRIPSLLCRIRTGDIEIFPQSIQSAIKKRTQWSGHIKPDDTLRQGDPFVRTSSASGSIELNLEPDGRVCNFQTDICNWQICFLSSWHWPFSIIQRRSQETRPSQRRPIR
jgi:hypothetical protein